ncbi:MAG: hypothetical protein ACYDCF_04575 [Burkholderiales bacterium]
MIREIAVSNRRWGCGAPISLDQDQRSGQFYLTDDPESTNEDGEYIYPTAKCSPFQAFSWLLEETRMTPEEASKITDMPVDSSLVSYWGLVQEERQKTQRVLKS